LYVVVPGVLVALAGLTFALQGMGIVGPSSSFMFQNPAWILDGAALLVVGLLVVAAGAFTGGKKA